MEGRTKKGQREAVVQAMVNLSSRLSSDIHNPDVLAIPTQLVFFSRRCAAQMCLVLSVSLTTPRLPPL